MSKPNVKMKIAMFEQRMSNGELAERVGVAPSTISLILNGKADPKLSVAKKIAKELGMSLDELWGDSEDE